MRVFFRQATGTVFGNLLGEENLAGAWVRCSLSEFERDGRVMLESAQNSDEGSGGPGAGDRLHLKRLKMVLCGYLLMVTRYHKTSGQRATQYYGTWYLGTWEHDGERRSQNLTHQHLRVAHEPSGVELRVKGSWL